MLDMQVLLRGRVATVRGKGKSAFLVLRQRTATVQVGVLPACLTSVHAGKGVAHCNFAAHAVVLHAVPYAYP